MRILIVNTSEKTGGAAVASHRLMTALKHHGVKVKMLVGEKLSDNPSVVVLPHRWLQSLHFLWERWCVFCHLHFSRQGLFEIDLANAGTDITCLPEFREADVVHLQWINQGMLSLNDIRRILQSGKPVVWTMHDLWPLSSLCHYARGCDGFKNGCGHCRLLPGGGSPHDVSRKVMLRKQHLLTNGKVTFVTCSEWLAGQARESVLAQGQRVMSIPNCIDTAIYCPGNREEARRRLGLPTGLGRLILFVSQKVTDQRKGMNYFVEAMHLLAAEEACGDYGVMVLGGHAEEVVGSIPQAVYPLGYVSDEQKIVDVYRAADVYVLPSLEDNLPNTIMEAMACGTPCVGFSTGGIPEMIDADGDYPNGYVAQASDATDLARGIRQVLRDDCYDVYAQNAVRKVAASWSQQRVAARYKAVYEECLNAQIAES